MSVSPNLALAYIVASQAQKEVTHNEAINHLDALVQSIALTMGENTPPVLPTEGAVYIVGDVPVDAWSDQAGKIACYYGGWEFKTPKHGWSVYIKDQKSFAIFNGTAWQLQDINEIYNWTPGSIAAGGSVSSGSIAVAGALFGDFIVVSAPYDLQSVNVSAYVKAAGTITISIFNPNASSVVLAQGDWKIRILKG